MKVARKCGTCLFRWKSVRHKSHFCSAPIPTPVLPACVPKDYFIINASARRSKNMKFHDGKDCQLWEPKRELA